MRTRSILRIGITVSVSIFSASSVEVAIGRRRNRRVLRHSSALPEHSNRRSNREYVDGIPRYLGVGLNNLKYGEIRGQHHADEARGKSKGKGKYYSDDFRGKGKGYSPSHGKGSGKGDNNSGSIDTEDTSRLSPTDPPFSTPTISTKSSKPTNQKKEYVDSKRGKQSKLMKSEKASPTFKPILHPTRLPSSDKPTPSPSNTSTDKSNKLPSSISNHDDQTISLTPFTIQYTVTNDERPPFRSELLEVVQLTRIYLDRYFFSVYEKSELTNLSKVMTLFTNTAFEFGEAIPIEYESEAVLKLSSVLLPDKEDLDNILVSAFEGDDLDGYIGLLQSLPPSNIFSSTQYAKLVQTVEESPSKKSENMSRKSIAKNMTLAAIVVGGAAGLILIFVSTRLLHRRRHYNESDGSIFGNKSCGTIAGETYTTRGSRQDDRMTRPICDELYNDAIENRR